MNTNLLLDMACDAMGNRPAVGLAAEAITFAGLSERAGRAAALIAETRADNLVFIGLNGLALPVAVFASGRLGKPFAPLNYRLPDPDLNRLLARTAPSVAIVDDDMLHRLKAPSDVALVPRSAFEAASVDAARHAPEPHPDPDVAILLFTSGTTGEPKAAVLRHRHLAAYVIAAVDFASAEDGEAALVSVPPYHIAGVSAALSSVFAGRRVVHLAAFTPEAWVDTVANEHITHAMVVPTMLSQILEVMEARDESLPSLRSLSYGGGRMPLSVIQRAIRQMPHVDFANAYGLTETSSTIAVLGPEDHRVAVTADTETGRRRLASVGRPLPSVEIEIHRPDGSRAEPGEAGEVWVRGDQVAGEYMAKSLLRDGGWFPTNDAGWMDEDGYLFVDGRLDDVIVRGGENISPGEVEDVLRSHPAVADVAVLGAPDDQWGERVAAVVVARAPVAGEALRAWVKDRLRSTKTPEDIHFRDALPYNETGKLLRRVLRAELAKATPIAAGT
jgi:fatty-acyl-CoA synthase